MAHKACQHTGKRRYKDEIAAQLALISTGKEGKNKRKRRAEVRYYKCEFCRGFHLTSRR